MATMRKLAYKDKSGGEVGIRTPGRGFSPYNGLANCLFHRPVVRIQ